MDYRAVFVAPGLLRLMANDLPDFTVGERVMVSVDRERSPASHKHQFAFVAEAWRNIREEDLDQPWAATADTLRKHALIATGYHQTYSIDCGAKATAQNMKAALVAAEFRAHGYAIGQVRGPMLTIWTPESQSLRAMGGDRFKESKAAILDWIADKIGVSSDDLRRAA